MNVPPFIEFMCGMGTAPSSQNSSHGLPTTQTSAGTATSNPSLEQQQEETNEDTLQMTEQIHHEDLSCIQSEGEEWSLFDFSSNPPFCCTDSAVDTVFRLPVKNSMGGDAGCAALTQLSREMALFETEEGEDEDEAAGFDVHTSKKEEDVNTEESSQEEEGEGKAKEVMGVETLASPVAFHPPLFRNMTFHSVSSRSDGVYEYDRNRRLTIIPNDTSTIISSSPTSLSRSRVSNSLDQKYSIEPLPIDFAPPRHNFDATSTTTTTTAVNCQAQAQQEFVSKQDFSFETSLSFNGSGSDTVKLRNHQECFNELRPQDIICGRGQPTLTHPGNLAFKQVMQEHEMTYLCARRSEKPKIAWALLDEFRAKGVRFVKREKRGSALVDHPATVSKSNDDHSLRNAEDYVWVEIGDKRAYAKITQSLREEAPQLRRQLLGSTKTKTATATEPSSEDSKKKSNSATRAADKKTKKAGKACVAKSSRKKNKKRANNTQNGEARDEVNVDTVGITTATIVGRQDSTSTVVEPQLSGSETEGSTATSMTTTTTTTSSMSTNTMKSVSPGSSSSSSFSYDHHHYHGRHHPHHSICDDSNPYYYYYHQYHRYGHGHHGYYGYYSNNYDYSAMNRNNSNGSGSGGSGSTGY